VRVLGVALQARSTQIRVDRMLVLHGGFGEQPRRRPADPAGRVGDALSRSSGRSSGTHHAVTVGVAARDGRKRLPFLLQYVPLARQAAPFRSAPPRRLPLIAGSRWAAPVPWVLLTAGPALFLGSLCCVVPWFTPAADLAVPVAVGVARFVVLRAARVDETARFMTAEAAATGRLALPGGPDDVLSPCRPVGGDPAGTADIFAAAVFRANRPAARALETPTAERYGRFLLHAVPPHTAGRAPAARRDFTSTQLWP
jgi:hypothetical protein